MPAIQARGRLQRKQSSKGWAAVPDGVKLPLPAKAKRLMNLGSVDPQTRRKLVRGRLVDNVIKGKDGGAMSAKILGSDSEPICGSLSLIKGSSSSAFRNRPSTPQDRDTEMPKRKSECLQCNQMSRT